MLISRIGVEVTQSLLDYIGQQDERRLDPEHRGGLPEGVSVQRLFDREAQTIHARGMTRFPRAAQGSELALARRDARRRWVARLGVFSIQPRPVPAEPAVAPSEEPCPPEADIKGRVVVAFESPVDADTVVRALQDLPWVVSVDQPREVRGASGSAYDSGPVGVGISRWRSLFGSTGGCNKARIGLLELGVRTKITSDGRVVDHDALERPVPVRGGSSFVGDEDHRRHGIQMIGILAAKSSTSIPYGGLVKSCSELFIRLSLPSGSEPEKGVADPTTSTMPCAADLARAIYLMAFELGAGGVIIAPLQFVQDQGGIPIESDPAVWCAVRCATLWGVTVVLASGNEAQWPTSPPMHFISHDSGSIIAGYADSPGSLCTNRLRLDAAPRPIHPRINAHSWGDSVPTLHYEIPTEGEQTSGSSATSCIIGSVAAHIQSLYSRFHPYAAPLEPTRIRDWISKYGYPPVTTGCVDKDKNEIGIQPSLSSIGSNELYKLELVINKNSPLQPEIPTIWAAPSSRTAIELLRYADQIGLQAERRPMADREPHHTTKSEAGEAELEHKGRQRRSRTGLTITIAGQPVARHVSLAAAKMVLDDLREALRDEPPAFTTC